MMKEPTDYADLGAILEVLAELKDVIDFVRCSAVCKSWQAACQRVHPTSIYVSPDVHSTEASINPEGLVAVVKWLQLKNQAGCCDSLQRLLVSINGDDCTANCHQQQRLQLFSQSIAALAGSWHLRRLMLVLHSPLDMAVPMLPLSLRHLVLELHTSTLPDNVALSMFEGLKELQKLELVLSSKFKENIAKRQQTAGFRVDAHFSAMTRLKLSPWGIRMPAGRVLSDYMPNLQNLNVFVAPVQAQSLLDLASLHTLTLNIIFFPVMMLDFSRIEVSAACHLRFLKVFCFTTNNMELLVNNANVDYFIQGVHSVTTPLAIRVDLDADPFSGELSD